MKEYAVFEIMTPNEGVDYTLEIQNWLNLHSKDGWSYLDFIPVKYKEKMLGIIVVVKDKTE
jgi:hypothetical protein